MRVHPSQYTPPLQFGERLPLLAGMATLFFLLILGSALFGRHLSFSAMWTKSEFTAVLTTQGQEVALFTAKASGGGAPDLSPLEKGFLNQAASFGEIQFRPVSESQHLPVLETKSVPALKFLLEKLAPKLEHSIIFSPGSSVIYRIDPEGKISTVQANGSTTE